MPWWQVNSGGWGRPKGRGEMNCGNLGEECRRRDFLGDTNNINCLTSIKFLKQSDQITTEKKWNIYCSWSNKFNIWRIHVIAETFVTRIYIAALVLQFYFNPLTPVQAMTSLCLPLLSRPHFWPKLTSSMYAQLLQVERIFSIIPRSECSASWCLRYAQKVEWKIWSKISCHYTWLLHGEICSSLWCPLWSFLAASKPIRRPITEAKRKEKGKKEKRKEKLK